MTGARMSSRLRRDAGDGAAAADTGRLARVRLFVRVRGYSHFLYFKLCLSWGQRLKEQRCVSRPSHPPFDSVSTRGRELMAKVQLRLKKRRVNYKCQRGNSGPDSCMASCWALISLAEQGVQLAEELPFRELSEPVMQQVPNSRCKSKEHAIPIQVHLSEERRGVVGNGIVIEDLFRALMLIVPLMSTETIHKMKWWGKVGGGSCVCAFSVTPSSARKKKKRIVPSGDCDQAGLGVKPILLRVNEPTARCSSGQLMSSLTQTYHMTSRVT
ncbi:uncharacterized protein LOC122351495 [Puntigrus tetrazona]|uniref:uncharacterized protein LOC122351495 n=1 Tax=Puntigrus tetrazona TaxID=1606681 RepID=UPI001C88EF65|nr:uncharacterized protein LOC122351495 [Puntigrus tetrazona]